MIFRFLTDRFYFERSWNWYFAIVPTVMDDGTVIWLEKFRARYIDTGSMDVSYRWQRHLTEEEDW